MVSLRLRAAIFFVIVLYLVHPSAGDLCAVGGQQIDGNYYCQPVDSIQYSNVGTAGTYNEVIFMGKDGQCDKQPKSFTGPISPLDEQLSWHFRGPIHLKQFAAYLPSNTAAGKFIKDRSAQAGPAKVPAAADNLIGKFKKHFGHGHAHTDDRKAKVSGKKATHEHTPGHIHKRMTDPAGNKKREEVTATIDAKIVTWENVYSGEATPGADKANPSTVTAVIDGKTQTWLNNWFGPSSANLPPANNVPTSWTPATTSPGDISSVVPTLSTLYTPASDTLDSPAGSSLVTSSVNPTHVSSADEQTSASTTGPKSPPSPVNPLAPPPTVSFSGGFDRIAYYDAESQTSENLVFLGNHGGQGSGVFDYSFGASLAYANAQGNGGSATPQILEDIVIASGQEVVLMLSEQCTNSTCDYWRPGSVAHVGFGGGSKLFFFEFIMPMDNQTGFEGDMPAIWALNANIPRTDQYSGCSCWPACGELDIAEALSDGSTMLKSTLHTNTPAGDSDYFERPVHRSLKFLAGMDDVSATVHLVKLDDDTEFSSFLTADAVNQICNGDGTSIISHFAVS